MEYRLESEKNNKFIEIYSRDGIYYGGNQSHYPIERMIINGCGPIAVTNSFIYNLNKGHTRISLEDYLNISTEIYKILDPSPLGLLSFKKVINRTIEYSRKNGMDLDYRFLNNSSYEKYLDFIKSGIIKNAPILALNINFNFKKSFYWHWITITGLIDDDKSQKIIVSSWGRRYILDFREYFNSLMPGSGMVYFFRR